MKKILIVLALCASVFAFANRPFTAYVNTVSITQTQDSVYICNSTTAYAYHSSPDCGGLNRCTHPIIKVSLHDATHKYGRQPCKLCE